LSVYDVLLFVLTSKFDCASYRACARGI